MSLFTVLNESFRLLSMSIFYDITDIDYLASGFKREGDIMALVSVLGTFITAISINLYGFLFDLFGFDPSLAVQTHVVQGYLSFSYILVPAFCFILCSLALHSCPITKDSLEIVKKAIILRSKGESYERYKDTIDKLI